MKVGDLVMLSTAGEAINQNSIARGGFGIIRKIVTRLTSDFPISTIWYVGDKQMRMCYKSYELKKFK